MAKSTRKKKKRVAPQKKTTADQSKAAEYVGHLLELHKLQGALLAQLYKEL